MKTLTLLANGTIGQCIISVLCLVILHFVSLEFKPNFRMISEYALGNHKWVLTIFFISWGLGSIVSGLMFLNIVTTAWAKFGAILVLVTGIGAIMGGLFDVQHKLHGLAFRIGIPFLPIGSLILSYHLIKNPDWQAFSFPLLWSSHAIWISLVLMVSQCFFFSQVLKTPEYPLARTLRL
jgi:hypothetical protein